MEIVNKNKESGFRLVVFARNLFFFFFCGKGKTYQTGKRGRQTMKQEEEGHVARSGLSWFLLRQ